MCAHRMTADRWKRIEEVYHSALDRAPEERAAFVAAACHGDAGLSQEVLDLVGRHQSSGAHPLDRPVWGSSAESTVGPVPGTRLGPYEIEASIGAGGMGQVFRARDTRLDRTVAVKVSLERFSDRFAREARAIASLNHPNICTLHDVGPDYLVMELVEGPTLTEHIRKGPLRLDEALAIARQIGAALEAAHDKGIVHRDLKPANIKVRPDGSVKVFDFGLAKSWALAEATQASAVVTAEMTGPGMVLGTPGYMSPEQAMGKEVDKRADIWAFGAVLYEMLAGRRVFDGDTAQEAMAAVLTREPDFELVPVPVRKLLRSCLEKDPKLRLRDVGDAWRLLEDAPSAPPRRRGGLAWIAAAAALSLVAAVALTGWWRARRVVDRPMLRLTLDLGPDAIGGAEADVAISPDGRRIAYPIRRPDGPSQLATRLLDQSQATVLPGTDDAVQPFFSPDGQWIAYRTHGALSKISVQGGAPVTLTTAASEVSMGGSWDADDIAAPLNHSSALFLIPAAGGPARPLTKLAPGERTHRWPQFLPDGKLVFTDAESTSAMENAGVAIFDRKSGAHKVVLRGGFHGRYVPGGFLLYAHQGALFATRFDLQKQAAQGSPIPLAENLAADSLTGNGHFDFSMPPEGSGTLVYVAGKPMSRQWGVSLLDASGRAEPLLAPGAYFNPSYSPDSRRLALTSGSDIFVADLARGTMTRLTSDSASDRPVWTPDGARIVYGSMLAPPGIWCVRGDGGDAPELLLRTERPVFPSSISPDGKRLAYFDVNPETGFDLWILPLDLTDPAHPKPGQPQPFLRTPFNECCASFSPDGRWIAYSSNEGGQNEIYVRPSSGAPGKWQISSGGAMYAAWAPNGSQLFYESSDNRIQVVDYVVKGDSLEAGKPRRWSNRQLQNVMKNNFAVAPNGKGLAIFEAPDLGGAPPHVGVLLNFIDELKRRLP
jgi:Tol biopolymer transport system component/tRNA A-37 threonylcarbamoyl transferase component Bud32